MNTQTKSAVLVAALAVAVIAGCAKKANPSAAGGAAAQGPPPLPVSVANARTGNIASRFSLTGTVDARQQGNLTSQITGQIAAVNVQIGDRVRAGQLLAKIDDSTYRAQLGQDEAAVSAARARLAQTSANDIGGQQTSTASLDSARVGRETAEANLRRNEQLFKQGYVAQSTLDQARQELAAAQAQERLAQVAAQNANLSSGNMTAAQADMKNAQAAVQQAQAAANYVQTQIGQTSIVAPFDGIVTQRNVDPGSTASQGTVLLQVSQVAPIYVDVGVPDEDLRYVRDGTAVTITIDALPARTWQGQVNNLNAATAQGTLSYLARVVLPNNDFALKAGMVANVNFTAAVHRGVLIVPRAALFQTENGDALYVAEQGKAKAVKVLRGLESGNDVEVSAAGLKAGTQVIVQRPDSLQDGSPIQIASAKGA